MCMTFILSEPIKHTLSRGVCRPMWTNFTECVATEVVISSGIRFNGVISTRVLQYLEISADARLAVLVVALCLGLLVMVVNGWLVISLQGAGLFTKPTAARHRQRHVIYLITSLLAAHSLHGAVTVYSMTSLLASASGDSVRTFRNKPSECLVANCLIFSSMCATLLHHVTIAIDRIHSIHRPQKQAFWWTPKRIFGTIAILWVLAVLLSFLPAMGWNEQFAYCMFFYQFTKDYLCLLSSVFLVGLITTGAIYSYIAMSARKLTVTTFNVTMGRICHRHDASLTVTAAILVAVSAICWAPLFLFLVFACPQCPLPSDNDFILMGTFCLALLAPLLNPIVYAIRMKRIRIMLTETLKQVCCNVKKRTGSFEVGDGRSNGVTFTSATGITMAHIGTANNYPRQFLDSIRNDMLY